MDPGKSLTRREFEDVMRRATELAAEGADADELLLDETELLRIAGEVGLPEQHVRRALAEVRTSVPQGGGALGRLFGPATVAAGRVVPGSREALGEAIDEFMVAGQLLQPVRRGPDLLSYRPAVDWASQIARAASATSKRHYVASAKSVEVTIEALEDERVFVQFDVDPGTRGDHMAGAFLGGGAAGVAAGVGLGIVTATAAPVVLAVAAGVVVGGAVSSSIVWATGRAHRRRLQDVRDEVEGILDRLESGETLEPPPPSWRRWVRRHFHGVARDLRGDRE
jgi:hypothetical protein